MFYKIFIQVEAVKVKKSNMHLSKYCNDQACVNGDRCQGLFVSHVKVAHVQMVVVSGNTDGQPL